MPYLGSQGTLLALPTYCPTGRPMGNPQAENQDRVGPGATKPKPA